MVDMLDPDCDSPDDASEAEEVLGPLAVLLEGIYDNGDGTFEAYFSYINLSAAEIPAAVGISQDGQVKNTFSPGPQSRGQPTVFKRGDVRGAFHFTFSGETLTWTVKVPGSNEMRIVVSANSPRLEPIEPIAECINQNKAGGFVATFGYLNPNEFEIVLPLGRRNKFAPGKEDRGQPNAFFSGRNTAVLLSEFDTELSWQLATKTAAVSPATKVCACTASSTAVTRERVIKTSEELGLLVFIATDRFERASLVRLKNAPPAAKKQFKKAIARAKERVARSVLTVKDLTSTIPEMSKNCPELPPGCSIVDDGPTISRLRSFFFSTQKSLVRTARRTNFLDPTVVKKNKATVGKAKAIVKLSIDELNKIPRFRTVCK